MAPEDETPDVLPRSSNRRLSRGDVVERYQIVELLGEGGMGTVYRARDMRLQRMVALKVLRTEAARDGAASDGPTRLLREARAAARLDHPNIVAVFDVGEVTLGDDPRPTTYLAMELIEGRSLRSCVGDTRVPMAERVRWLAQAARGLAHAHAAGIVHRDVKPENLMIRADGTLKVLDFGIAKRGAMAIAPATEPALATVTAQGIAVGTPAYMAPEQMRGEALDGRADQFAWGVVAYELAAGELPWGPIVDGLNLVACVLSKHPPPLGARAPEARAEVVRVVERALAKAPADRFASMDDLVRALESPSADVSTQPAPSATSAPSDEPSAVGAASAPRTAPSAQIATAATLPAPIAASAALPGVTNETAAPAARRLRRIALAGAAVLAVSAGAALLLRPRGARAIAHCAHARDCPGESICRSPDMVCVALGSTDCEVHAAPRALRNDRTVWIGAMLPRSGPHAESYGEMHRRAAELANRDFDEVLGALGEAGEARPLGLVACDTTLDATRAAHHLVDDVGVPAVLGFDDGAQLRTLAANVFLPRGVLALAALTTDPLVTRIPQRSGQPRLVWRTTRSAVTMARAAAAFVEGSLEARARAAAHLAPKTELKVALLRDRSPQARALADVLVERLRFNGKSAIENGARYGDFPLARAAGTPDVGHDGGAAGGAGEASDASADDTLDRLARFAPHIVVVVGGNGVLVETIDALERAQNAPYYVAAFAPNAIASTHAAKSEALRARVFGVNAIAERVVNARFALHYNDAFRDRPVTLELTPSESYDAFYVLAYSVYASGSGPITGEALARSLARLQPPGAPIDVGPSGIFDAYALLRDGKSVDVSGATGPLDLDPDSGEVFTNLALTCLAHDPRRSGEVAPIESGLVFDAKTEKLRGELQCAP